MYVSLKVIKKATDLIQSEESLIFPLIISVLTILKIFFVDDYSFQRFDGIVPNLTLEAQRKNSGIISLSKDTLYNTF